MNQKPDILDEIITQLDPETIPTEYIIMAKIRTYDGMESIINGNEFDDYIDQHADEIANVQVILNIRRIRQVIIETTEDIFRKARQY